MALGSPGIYINKQRQLQNVNGSVLGKHISLVLLSGNIIDGNVVKCTQDLTLVMKSTSMLPLALLLPLRPARPTDLVDDNMDVTVNKSPTPSFFSASSFSSIFTKKRQGLKIMLENINYLSTNWHVR